MNPTSVLLFGLFLAIGCLSIIALVIAYINIIVRNRKIDSIFYFWEYATDKDLMLIKLGSIGLIVSGILFVLL